MKLSDLVITTRDIGEIVMNSVGIIKSISRKGVLIDFVGKDNKVHVPSNSLSIINVDVDQEIITVESTGVEYPTRICNECYVLKPSKEMSNKMSARCKCCQKKIAGKSMSASEQRRMKEERLSDGSVFKCPICEKRLIVGIRKRIIVPDHDHKTGKGRQWICHSCNSALGRFRDDISILKKAIDYLRCFKSHDEHDV